MTTTIGFVTKFVVSAAIGGYIGAKAGDACGKGIDKIRKSLRERKQKEENDLMACFDKTYKIESLV